jgi:hypothetical protein
MDALQAEKEFQGSGEAKRSGSGKISPEIRLKDKAGQWVQGTLVRNEEVKTQFGNKRVIEIKLKDTNVTEASTKAKDGAITTMPVKIGQTYGIWTFTNLAYAVENLKVGTEVHITYEGTPNGGKARQGNPHQAKVLYKEPDNTPAEDTDL